MLTFKHALGECDSKEWISKRLVDACGRGYYIFLSILNLEGVTGEKKFFGRVSVVVPELARGKMNKINDGCEYHDEEYEAGAMWEYGYRADVWTTHSVNPLEAMHACLREAQNVPEYLEEYMSEVLNRIGWNGWKFCGAE
jgi:hypothetical protein